MIYFTIYGVHLKFIYGVQYIFIEIQKYIQLYNGYIHNIIITHSERALFNLNARVEARGTIVPKAVGRGYYGPERRHKGI